MDNARQVVRWSIPGLVLVLELAVFAATSHLAEGRDPLTVIETAGTTAAVVSLLAGVPLGFLLYQLYFRGYRPFGYSLLLTVRQLCVLPRDIARGGPAWKEMWLRGCTFVRTDRGAAILKEFLDRGGKAELIAHVWPHDELSEQDITKGVEDAATCAECRRRYEERFQRNWSIVMALLDFTSGFQNAEVIKTEYTSGSDIYHALGAARTAIVGAWYVALGYLLIVARPTMSVGEVALGALSISVLAFVQYKVLSSARRQAFLNLVARVAAGLAWFSRTDWQSETVAT